MESKEEKVSKICERLDNIKYLVSEIRKSVGPDEESKLRNSVRNRRKATMTENERATTDVDIPDEDTYKLRVEMEKVQQLSKKLRMIRDKLKEIGNGGGEAYEMSSSYRNAIDSVYAIYDEFNVRLFTLRDHQMPKYHIKLSEMKQKTYTSEQQLSEDLDELLEELDGIEDACEYVREGLGSVSFPGQEEIRDEIREEENQRARREMEELAPYMAMDKLQREFTVGETFTAEDLAETVDLWTVSTAESTIEDAMDENADSSPDVVQVDEDTYKLVDSE